MLNVLYIVYIVSFGNGTIVQIHSTVCKTSGRACALSSLVSGNHFRLHLLQLPSESLPEALLRVFQEPGILQQRMQLSLVLQ